MFALCMYHKCMLLSSWYLLSLVYLGSPSYVSVDITVLVSRRCVRQGLHFSPGMHRCLPTVLESTTKGAKTENGGINLKFLVNHLSSISELEASHWGILSSIKLILFGVLINFRCNSSILFFCSKVPLNHVKCFLIYLSIFMAL